MNKKERIREALRDLIADSVDGFWYCDRAWSAWEYGTMSQDDFYPVSDDEDWLYETADRIIGEHINSRNAEIEAKDRTITDLQKLSSDHVSYLSELSKKETEIEALKAEIKSMRCCGNCRTYRPWDSKCTNGNGLMRSDCSCGNWTRRTK